MFRKIIKYQVVDSLSRHKDVTNVFLKKVESIPKEILENVGTDFAKKAVAMSREVDGDLHEHKAFLRLSVSSHGILYAKLDKMIHNNEELLLKFFQKRFPTFIILIESRRGVFTMDNNSVIFSAKLSLEEALSELEENIPKNPLILEINGKNYQELWKSFAKSQIIKGRKTSRQIIRLSKKWHSTVPEEPSLVKKLDSFFDTN